MEDYEYHKRDKKSKKQDYIYNKKRIRQLEVIMEKKINNIDRNKS